MPGFKSQVVRLPNLGIGIFLGSNDDFMGQEVGDTILYRLLDEIMGLKPINWEERFVTRQLRKNSTHTSIPDDARLAPKTASLVGQYYDQGYGLLDLMSLEIDGGSDKVARISSPQAYLDEIYRAASTEIGISKPLLFTQVDKLFEAAHVYSHFDGPIFNVTVLNINQNLQGEYAAYRERSSTAVFVEGKGVGMFENFWGGDKGKKAVEVDVDKHAEVWYDKLRLDEQVPLAKLATHGVKVDTSTDIRVETPDLGESPGGTFGTASKGQVGNQAGIGEGAVEEQAEQYAGRDNWASTALFIRGQALGLVKYSWLGKQSKRAGERG